MGELQEEALAIFNRFLKLQGRESPVITDELQKKRRWRYFRLTTKGAEDCQKTLDDVRQQLLVNDIEGSEELLLCVGFCKNVFALPSHISLKRLQVHERGDIIGMDVSSCVAVEALQVQLGDRVLDLCCAPGAKLCHIADLIGSTGFVLGIDISIPRLDVTRSLLKRLGCKNAGLLHMDGTALELLLPSQPQSETVEVGTHEPSNEVWKNIAFEGNHWMMPHDYLRQRKRKRQQDSNWISLAKRFDSVEGNRMVLFDKVLVDAECTHDGSIKHIQKYGTQWGWETFEKRVLNEGRITQLNKLQSELLCVGFQYLKPGGLLVYSTCSSCHNQNEKVVESFLSTNPCAKCVKLPFMFQDVKKEWCLQSMSVPAIPIEIGSGGIVSGCRFDSSNGESSGLFLCLLTKIE